MTLPPGQRRSARLLFAAELADGRIGEEDLDRPEVTAAVAERRVPSRPARELQRLAMRRGRLRYEDEVLAPLAAARRAVLGSAADGPPRLLVRMDEFPHAQADDLPDRYGIDAFRRFHAILAEAGVPYLVAVLPRVSRDVYDPRGSEARDLRDDEAAALADARRDGAAFGLHGLDHRTRHRSPRRHSELIGLGRRALVERLERAEAVLAGRGIVPRVFVPPFNRFSWRQYDVLAERYDVVCGGPESVRHMGFQRTPEWRGDAVWLPAYPPLYGTAAQVLAGLERIADRAAGLWVPVVLHSGWEVDDGFAALPRLAARMAPLAASWHGFLDAVEASR